MPNVIRGMVVPQLSTMSAMDDCNLEDVHPQSMIQ